MKKSNSKKIEYTSQQGTMDEWKINIGIDRYNKAPAKANFFLPDKLKSKKTRIAFMLSTI